MLAAADGAKNTEIAQRLGVGRPMVTKWRNRFAQDRLDGLVDEPRPGRPRTISDEQVQEVVIKTLETKPAEATPGSIRADFGLEIGRNLVHASDGPETAATEIALWFGDDLVSWERATDRWIFE